MNIRQAIQILEIEKFGGIDDLKASFRAKAHLYHPDKNKDHDTSETFRKVLEAYEYALKNIAGVYAYFGVEEQPEDEATVKIVIENLDDIFEDIFGFSKKGRILGYQEPQVIYLTLNEFALGVKKRQKIVAYQTCTQCHGTGAQRGTLAKVCTYCFGHGTIKWNEAKTKKKLCPVCKGRGRKITRVCSHCDGFGRQRQYHQQEINIPVGLRPFEVYTLDSYDLETQSRTEVFMEPRFLRDPIFQIDNYDLLCEYHLDFKENTSDAFYNLLTPFGKVPMVISAHAKKGDVLKLNNCGLYKDARKKERGDLLVRLVEKKEPFLKRILGGLFE
ncbi:MAG: DnaJ domain-containing protein [Deltaproteobacteria bacterium]|nr:DnaJ domain-containing protein [Deltaproteobacteria bacterium]